MRSLVLLSFLMMAPQLAAADKARVVSIGGGVTEIVCALGHCEQLVAVDTSSLFPATLTAVPKIGYARSLSAEGILAQKPSVVILSEEAGPPDVVRKLETLKVPVHKISGDETVEGAVQRIREVGSALGEKPAAEKLASQLQSELDALAKSPEKAALAGKKVLFIYARGSKHLMVAGKNSALDSLITLTGASNAGDMVEGFRPLTAEAVIAAKPDVILMTSAGAQSIGGVDGVFALPGLKNTPAFQTKSLVLDDDLRLLTVGPRTPAVIQDLRKAFEGAKK